MSAVDDARPLLLSRGWGAAPCSGHGGLAGAGNSWFPLGVPITRPRPTG